MQDHLYTTEQRILSWKPPQPPAFKINLDAQLTDDKTSAVGAAVVRDADFHWFIGITRKIISPCMLEILLLTLREILLQVWSYHLDSIELDLDRDLLGELNAGPAACRSYLRGIVTDIQELLNRSWTISLNYSQRSVNLVASVLAFLQKHQRDVLVIHAEPPEEIKLHWSWI